MSSSSISYIGPAYRKIKDEVRTYYKFSNEETATIGVVPAPLLGSHIGPVDSQILAPQTDLAFMRKLSAFINNHFEGRIQIFIQQMLLVYKTNLKIEESHGADLQIGVPSATTEKLGDYACAHISTLPALIATPPKGERIAFADRSFFHLTWSATDYLPKSVNDADSHLDFILKVNRETFREKCVAILNQVSQGNLSLKKGLETFLQTAKEFLDRFKNDNEKEAKTEKAYTIQKYAGIVNFYLDELQNDSALLSKLCYTKDEDDEKQPEKCHESVHNQMWADLIKGMAPLEPKPIPADLISSASQSNPNAKIYHDLIAASRAKSNRTLTKTIETYKTLSLTDQNIKCLGQQYLNQSDQNKLEKDLLVLQKRYGTLSPELRTIQKTLIAFIKDKKNKKPKNIEMILFRLLEEIAKEQI